MPRATWLSHTVQVLCDELDQLGFWVSCDNAEALIRDRDRTVATNIGVSDIGARCYFSDDVIRDLARTWRSTWPPNNPAPTP